MYETIDRDFKTALKAKDEVRVSVLRMLKTAVKNKEVELKRRLETSEYLGVISNQAKQRRDSLEQFRSGGRDDLAEREQAELVILEGYLPSQLSEEELDAAVAEIIAESGAESPKDMGRVMKLFMSRYQGQVDGKAASAAVKNKLSGG